MPKMLGCCCCGCCDEESTRRSKLFCGFGVAIGWCDTAIGPVTEIDGKPSCMREFVRCYREGMEYLSKVQLLRVKGYLRIKVEFHASVKAFVL